MSIQTDYSRLELLSLTESPYSQRIVWALHVLKFEYKQLEYAPMAGELPLRWRLGRWKLWERVTVPVGFVIFSDSSKPELPLEHGFDIVEWADDKAGAASLVPSTTRGEVVRMCRLADDLLEFDRQMFLKASWKDPSLFREMLGDGPPDFVLTIISFISGTFMSCKYRSTLQGSVPETREKFGVLQQEIATKQKKHPDKELVYLVGDSLTLADIYVSLAVCGGPKATSSKIYNAIAEISFDIKEDYSVLHKWALAITEKHGIPDKKL